MNDQEHSELSHEIAELRREVQNTRRWVIFVAVICSVLFLFPGLRDGIAGFISRYLDLLGALMIPIAAILAVTILAAFVVSRLAPESSERSVEQKQ